MAMTSARSRKLHGETEPWRPTLPTNPEASTPAFPCAPFFEEGRAKVFGGALSEMCALLVAAVIGRTQSETARHGCRAWPPPSTPKFVARAGTHLDRSQTATPPRRPGAVPRWPAPKSGCASAILAEQRARCHRRPQIKGILTLTNRSIKMPNVRTTLTLDPDVGKLLEQEVQRSRRPFKQVVNEALRKGLTRAAPRARKLELKVRDSRLLPGYDPASFNALADELEDAETMKKAARGESRVRKK